MERFSLSVPAAIVIAGLLVAASVLFVGSGGLALIFHSGVVATPQPGTGGGDITVDPSSVMGTGDPVLGNADAKVTIVEFSDFQCPYCRQFYVDTFAQLKKDYIDTGKVRLVYRDFPLTSLHPSARPAALAGACAQEQGKFWEFHDTVFSEQQKQEPDPSQVSKTMTFTTSDLKKWAATISGLNAAQFDQCLDSQKYANEVDADIAAGSANGPDGYPLVSGTPTFFINGQRLVGAQPFSAFQQTIDAALAK
ncbi:MAG TPA: DsbA family protein [Candidatus Paceibacterota bacterium]|nr:DsbA family protein [Candidatus Paceibacterota bacterium]